MLRLLQLAHDLDRDFVRLGAADDGGEAGHAAVHQLDAPRAQLDVVDRAVEMTVRSLPRRSVSGLVKAVPPASWKPGIGSGCRP